MSTELTVSYSSGLFAAVGASQGSNTLEAHRRARPDKDEVSPVGDDKPRFHDEPKLSTSSATKSLTDGAELTLIEAPQRPSPSFEAASNAYERQEPRFESAADKKARLEENAVKGVQPRKVPAEPDPQDPPHARAARDIAERAERAREEATEERAAKERRVIAILRNPELYGFEETA